MILSEFWIFFPWWTLKSWNLDNLRICNMVPLFIHINGFCGCRRILVICPHLLAFCGEKCWADDGYLFSFSLTFEIWHQGAVMNTKEWSDWKETRNKINKKLSLFSKWGSFGRSSVFPKGKRWPLLTHFIYAFIGNDPNYFLPMIAQFQPYCWLELI